MSPHPLLRRTPAGLLELFLVAALALTALLGVARPLLGPAVTGRIGGPLLGGPFWGRSPSVDATLDMSRVSVRTSPELPDLTGGGPDGIAPGDGLYATIPHKTTIAVHDPDLGQLVGLVGAEVLVGLLASAVLVLLLLVVRTLRRGDPFVTANARRLYLIAALVGLGGQAAVALRAWGEAAVLGNPVIAPYVLQEAELSPVPLVAGLGIAVAAEVFRQGAVLREDVEGLV